MCLLTAAWCAHRFETWDPCVSLSFILPHSKIVLSAPPFPTSTPRHFALSSSLQLGYLGEVYNPFRILSREVIVRAPTHGGTEGPIAEAVKAGPQGEW